MKRKIVFATNNAHKLQEMRQIAGENFEILSLADIGCHEELPETADTLEGNAAMKAQYVFDHYGFDCFADDTGLEVAALNGAPGVHSARYATDGHDDVANTALLLRNLSGQPNRAAQFRTAIALIERGQLRCFEGKVEGAIATARSGSGGFGYDPVFIPNGHSCSFAEMTPEQKNAISHRARAAAALFDYLNCKK